MWKKSKETTSPPVSSKKKRGFGGGRAKGAHVSSGRCSLRQGFGQKESVEWEFSFSKALKKVRRDVGRFVGSEAFQPLDMRDSDLHGQQPVGCVGVLNGDSWIEGFGRLIALRGIQWEKKIQGCLKSLQNTKGMDPP